MFSFNSGNTGQQLAQALLSGKNNLLICTSKALINTFYVLFNQDKN